MTLESSSVQARTQAALERLRERVAALGATPGTIDLPPAFMAFQSAITRSLTTFTEWAEQQLAEGRLDDGPGTSGLHKASSHRGRAARRVPTSVADILLETDRLTFALDAFMTDPLEDAVRADLIDLVDEVLEPILASSSSAASRGGARSKSPTTEAPSTFVPSDDAATRSPPLRVPEASSDKTGDEVTKAQPGPLEPHASRASQAPEDLVRSAPSEHPAPTPTLATPRLSLIDAELEHRLMARQSELHERVERLSRRLNTGFFLIGLVGLGLLALNLQELFRRAQPASDALVQVAPAAGPAQGPTIERPPESNVERRLDLSEVEALAQQIQASGEEIAVSLARWGEGPGQTINALSERMGNVENDILLIKTGMDELSAELQSQSRGSMLADIPEPAVVPHDTLAQTDGPVATSPSSGLTALQSADGESATAPEVDGAESAAVEAIPEPAETDLDLPAAGALEEARLQAAHASHPEIAAFTAVIPPEEMTLTVPAYGVQLGAMRRESGARALAAMTQLDPDTLYIQAAGSWQFVIFGWFAEREEALAAMDAMPESVRQLRPLIRLVDAGARVKPIEGPLIR